MKTNITQAKNLKWNRNCNLFNDSSSAGSNIIWSFFFRFLRTFYTYVCIKRCGCIQRIVYYTLRCYYVSRIIDPKKSYISVVMMISGKQLAWSFNNNFILQGLQLLPELQDVRRGCRGAQASEGTRVG